MSLHEKYMKMALAEAELALKAGDFPVGCVIGDESGPLVRARRINSRYGNELDHAEIVALRRLHDGSSGKTPGELTIYSTMEPCLMCFSTLILNNVHTIVYAYEDAMGGGTSLPLAGLKPLYSSKKVVVVPDVLRRESLALFKRFFREDLHGYWRNSLLAEYTLKQ